MLTTDIMSLFTSLQRNYTTRWENWRRRPLFIDVVVVIV